MEPRRIIVGTSLANVDEQSAAPLVGLLAWSNFNEQICSIIIKARFAKGAPSKILRPATLFARPAQADPLDRPVDFVPSRGAVNIVVVGHVVLTGTPGHPLHWAGSLIAGGKPTKLDFRAPSPGRVSLKPPYVLIAPLEGPDAALGPRNLHDGATRNFVYGEFFDYGIYHTAAPELRLEKLEESSKIVLSIEAGLTSTGSLADRVFEIDMPPVTPRVIVDPAAQGRRKQPLYPYLDTVLVDVDKSEIELTWRAYFLTYDGVSDINRLTVGWASDAQMKRSKSGWQAILRDLPLGHFEHAWFFTDADKGIPPDALSPERDRFHRNQARSFPLAPEPRLELDRYADICVELSQKREPRATVLARYGLSDPRFSIEEQGWLQRVTIETRRHRGHSPTATKLVEARALARERLALSEGAETVRRGKP